MRVKEVAARFRTATDTAWFDGMPANPKKILALMQKSLNETTGYKFKMTPTLIRENRYYGIFRFEGVTIEVQVQWDSPYGARAYSLEKPSIIAVNPTAYDRTVFTYHMALTTETITLLWMGQAARRITHDVERRRSHPEYYIGDGEL